MSTGSLAIGIDFGTTNSAMAWFNPDTKQAEVILNAESEPKTPSLVYFGEDETLVGKPVEALVEDSEDYEEEERLDITRRVVRSIKRNLIAPPVIPIPDRKPVRPVEVVAQILKKLKRDAEGEHFHEEVRRAVITCPAVFSSVQRRVIFDAAATAGFELVDLVEEPVAAAMAFSRLGRKVGRGTLVYDLGGGTFDLAVVAREEEDLFEVAMEPDGDERCGGEDFDRAIYDYCEAFAERELGRSLSEAEGLVNPYFLNECRKQKERLSSLSGNRQVVIREHLDGILFKRPLDHETFEGLIADEVEKTARKAASMVERAKSRGHEVDTVVLIGGSSRVPLVDRRLKETLHVEPQRFANKDYAVALGAAYYASVLKIPPREQYRRALEVGWVGGKLGREEVERLVELVEEIQLSRGEIESIERQVLGATLEEVLSSQREQYRDAVEEGWARINALAVELGLSQREAAEIDYEVIGDLKEASLLAQRPDPKTIVSLDPENLTLTKTLSGHTGEVNSVAFSPDGQLLASGSHDKTIKLWEPHSGRLLSTLGGSTAWVRSVAFSPDGQLLASGSSDKTIKLWESRSGRLLSALSGHTGWVRSVAFSPDGQLLASGSGDETVKVWG